MSKGEQNTNGILTEELLRVLFNENEIYTYGFDVSQEYKDFKENVISHLKFLKKRCKEGMEKDNIQTLNGINNHITSFLIKNHLIEWKEEEN